jgi:CheY-like chemotaxis protein
MSHPIDPSETSRMGCKPVTVLVVDDEESVRELISVILECQGFRVLTAASGDEALAVCDGEHPDLVTLDIMMPGMDGWEVGRRLAASPRTSDIRRLVVSAKPLSELENDPHRDEVHAVLTKPFDFTTFVEVVDDVLAHAA